MKSTVPVKNEKKKTLIFENAIRLLKGRQKIIYGFESKTFELGKQRHGKELEILNISNSSRASKRG